MRSFILLLVLALMACGQPCCGQPDARESQALRVLKVARDSVDAYRALPYKDVGSGLEALARVVDCVSKVRGTSMDAAVRDAITFGFTLGPRVSDARQRAEAERILVLALARLDHDAAVQLAKQISGPQTRARTLQDLGSLAYATVPAEPRLQVGYFRERALRATDPAEATRLWVQAMDAAIRVGRGKDPIGYAAQPLASAPLPDLRRVEQKLAVVYLRRRLEVERLALNGGGSHFYKEFDGLFIPYLERLVAVAPELAVEEARGHEFQTSPHGLSAVAELTVARGLSDRRTAVGLAEEARKKVEQMDEVEHGQLTLAGYAIGLKEIDAFIRGGVPRPVAPVRGLDAIVAQIKQGAGNDTPWYEQFKRLAVVDPTAWAGLRSRILPVIRAVPEPHLRAQLTVEAIGLLKDVDRKTAVSLAHEAVKALIDTQGYNFPTAEVMCAWLSVEPDAACAFVKKGLVETIGAPSDISNVLRCMLDVDEKWVLDLLERSRPASSELRAPLGQYSAFVAPTILFVVARRKLARDGVDAAMAWLTRFPPFDDVFYRAVRDDFIRLLVKEHLDAALCWARESTVAEVRAGLARRIVAVDPTQGRALLAQVQDVVLQAGLANDLALDGDLEDAVSMLEHIGDGAWRLAAAVDVARAFCAE